MTLSMAGPVALTVISFDPGFAGAFPFDLGIAILRLVSLPVSWCIVRLLREVETA